MLEQNHWAIKTDVRKSIIDFIKKNGPCGITDISVGLDLKRQNVTGFINRLRANSSLIKIAHSLYATPGQAQGYEALKHEGK